MLPLNTILSTSIEKNASDIYIVSGAPVSYRKNGNISHLDKYIIHAADAESLLVKIYDLAGRDLQILKECGDDDFSFSISGLSRFRVSTYMQRGSMAAVIRIIPFGIPDYRKLMIPEEVMAVSDKKRVLLLLPVRQAEASQLLWHVLLIRLTVPVRDI